jgi:hypothetical protein
MSDNQSDVCDNNQDMIWNYGILFHRLCSMDEEDRKKNRESQWHDTNTLKKELKAFGNAADATYVAEAVLLETQYIERDPHTNNVRLTKRGRDNCSNQIKIPPSDIDKMIEKYGGTDILRQQLDAELNNTKH